MHANDRREPATRDHAETAAHHLYADHKRKRKQRGPQRAIAESRAGNGVGRNAGRIVIGAARDQPGTQIPKKHIDSIKYPLLRFALDHRPLLVRGTNGKICSVPILRQIILHSLFRGSGLAYLHDREMPLSNATFRTMVNEQLSGRRRNSLELPPVFWNQSLLWRAGGVPPFAGGPVAPLARFISAITWTFLFEQSALGLRADFLGSGNFFAALVLLGTDLRFAGDASVGGVSWLRLVWHSSLSIAVLQTH
jgi:hypothetical protein